MTIQRIWRPKAEPHLPPDYDEDTILAIRAWSLGAANPEQQKLAWHYVMYLTNASEEFADLSYRPGEQGALATAFAEGKRHPGLALRKLMRPELTPIGKQAVPLKPAERVRAARQKKLKAPGDN